MKLVLLLLAIYSLIFYQSYKIEKLKDNFIDAKEKPATKKFNQMGDEENKNFQNAVLLTKDHNDNKIDRFSLKMQPMLRPLIFY